MENVGWAAAALPALGGLLVVVSYVLDQVPVLSAKAERAIAALRRLRATWRASGEAAQDEKSLREDGEQEDAGQRP